MFRVCGLSRVTTFILLYNYIVIQRAVLGAWLHANDLLGRVFYDRATVYIHQSFLKVVVYVIVINQ